MSCENYDQGSSDQRSTSNFERKSTTFYNSKLISFFKSMVQTVENIPAKWSITPQSSLSSDTEQSLYHLAHSISWEEKEEKKKKNVQ